jgi:hypothetical protein
MRVFFIYGVFLATCAPSSLALLLSSRSHDPRLRGPRLLLMADATITAEMRDVSFSSTPAGIDMAFNRRPRQMLPCCPRVRRPSVFFRQFRPSGPSFFLRFVLALSGGTSSPGPPLLRTGSIRVLLERNPLKRPLGSGWRLRLWGERAISLLTKKRTICLTNTLNRLEKTGTPLPPLTLR